MYRFLWTVIWIWISISNARASQVPGWGQKSSALYQSMLNVVKGITNRELIPWYQCPFVDARMMESEAWLVLHRIECRAGRKPSSSTFSFDLSGLGLEGHVDLGCLPPNVFNIDLSNNKLSSISFVGDGETSQCRTRYKLRELNVQKNNDLRINLAELVKSSLVSNLKRLHISSNQLVVTSVDNQPTELVLESAVQQLIRGTNLNEVVLDELVIKDERQQCVALLKMVTGIEHKKQMQWFQERVKSLSSEVSFDQVDAVNDLVRFRGKSLDTLDIEHHDRLQERLERLSVYFGPVSQQHRLSRRLQLSSNQLSSEMVGNGPHFGVHNWLYRQRLSDFLVLDETAPIIRCKDWTSLCQSMLNVVEGVTNKEVITWYDSFVEERIMTPDELLKHRIKGGGGRRKTCSLFSFDLSGLGLEGHIDLGGLPTNVVKIDLSKNKLSSISFVGDGKTSKYKLRELNVQKNNGLRIDLGKLDKSSPLISGLKKLHISSNQLVNTESKGLPMDIMVQKWMSDTKWSEIVIDNVVIKRN